MTRGKRSAFVDLFIMLGHGTWSYRVASGRVSIRGPGLKQSHVVRIDELGLPAAKLEHAERRGDLAGAVTPDLICKYIATNLLKDKPADKPASKCSQCFTAEATWCTECVDKLVRAERQRAGRSPMRRHVTFHLDVVYNAGQTDAGSIALAVNRILRLPAVAEEIEKEPGRLQIHEPYLPDEA